MNRDERQQARERQRRHREREAAGLPMIYCGARTKAATPCRRPAGAGTDHSGHGACSLHGGSTPTHRVKAAREQAAAEVRVMLGSQLDVDGDEALRTAMGIAAANVAVFQAKLAEMHGAPLDRRTLDLYRLQIDAVDRLGRWAKAAIDVDLRGRQATIAEHQAGQITTAFERAVGRLGMPRADLAALVNDFADELQVLEHTSADPLDDGLS